ncbi:hypothetical protein BO99DRAFT_404396 [Aspergillus violaceofuscus CBS 115571]|uniref:Uncharacterized protein n=1 Tax=Aspergillus violaceofuscus (strain CBS 115571) TaxID=1450538 RepID=A0A2V5H5Q3_ASPV1|nr:hypothetical protein BO99DRAFT_404396 [Aspergillus violaceofuscus CBS 115571]
MSYLYRSTTFIMVKETTFTDTQDGLKNLADFIGRHHGSGYRHYSNVLGPSLRIHQQMSSNSSP